MSGSFTDPRLPLPPDEVERLRREARTLRDAVIRAMLRDLGARLRRFVAGTSESDCPDCPPRGSWA